MGNKNLIRRKSIGGRVLAGEGTEQILGWWGDSSSRENPVKAKKKNSFYNFDNFKN